NHQTCPAMPEPPYDQASDVPNVESPRFRAVETGGRNMRMCLDDHAIFCSPNSLPFRLTGTQSKILQDKGAGFGRSRLGTSVPGHQRRFSVHAPVAGRAGWAGFLRNAAEGIGGAASAVSAA